MEDQPDRLRRLSLTKKQLHEEKGAALLALLNNISADGVLEDSEILRLVGWLKTHQDDEIPAIAYLSHLVEGVIANGSLETIDRGNLQEAIEKVLPVAERKAAKAAREHTGYVEKADSIPRAKISAGDLETMRVDGPVEFETKKEAPWRNDPMTERQYDFIRSMGASISKQATKGQASELIGSLLNNRSISSRQQMVMRFWNRTQRTGEGRQEITLWMDGFYEEDPDRKAAWELYKEEVEDNGLQGEPERVPIGIGPDYLDRIKKGGEASVPKYRESRVRTRIPPSWILSGAVAMIVLGFGLNAFLFKTREVVPEARLERQMTSPTALALIPDENKKDTITAGAKQPDNRISRIESQLSATRHFVMSLNIDGIVGGDLNRVSIGGHWVKQGETIDQALGIIVSRIDPETRTIAFTDSIGNVVNRRLE
jgi:hypothetical protein